MNENRLAGTVVDVDDLASLAGRHLGTSSWHVITQDQVDRFAEATGDRQWIHVDHRRAKAGPFNGTIAHGYLTLSLGPALLDEVIDVVGTTRVINYGLNKVRFPAPVPTGSRVRLGAGLREVDDVPGGLQAAFELTFAVEGREKPACYAEALFRYYR
ncbi:MAG: MaoC family dehydratase [Actinobacteria bacterium]|nr:MaoC family dehydratase [Actinomycetota bacterium]